MTENEGNSICVGELINLFIDYIDVSNSIYKLRATTEQEIKEVYNKKILIEPKIMYPWKVLYIISEAIMYNNYYIMSYIALIKLIYDEYHPQLNNVDYLIYDIFNQINDINLNKNREIITKNRPPRSPILKAIMLDDLPAFIVETNHLNFYNLMYIRTYNQDYYPDFEQFFTFIDFACYYGSVRIFKYMVGEYELSVTKRSLRLALLGGNAEIIHECLKYYIPDKRCMKYAIISHNVDIISFLVNEFNLDIHLVDCVYYFNIQAFFIYLDITNNINLCIPTAASFNIKPLVEYFISKGADINSDFPNGKTALHYAAINNNLDIAELLLSHGANINATNSYGESALTYAVMYNCIDMVKYLVQLGVNIEEKDNKGYNALHHAARNKYFEIVEFLISSGANINTRDETGQTALHHVASKNDIEMLEFLIVKGIDINSIDNSGRTSIFCAAEIGNKEIVYNLILHEAFINIQDNEGRTALHISVDKNRQEIAEFLITHGADVNLQDNNGQTPLHYAVKYNRIKIGEFLISYGSNINTEDKSGKKAFDIAFKKKNSKMAKLLAGHEEADKIDKLKSIFMIF